MAGKPADPQEVGLPPFIFLFTVDQIAGMLNIELSTLMVQYLYYAGRSSGRKASHQMDAVNIAPEDALPDWRVPAREFLQWCKRRNIKVNQLSGLR